MLIPFSFTRLGLCAWSSCSLTSIIFEWCHVGNKILYNSHFLYVPSSKTVTVFEFNFEVARFKGADQITLYMAWTIPQMIFRKCSSHSRKYMKLEYSRRLGKTEDVRKLQKRKRNSSLVNKEFLLFLVFLKSCIVQNK